MYDERLKKSSNPWKVAYETRIHVSNVHDFVVGHVVHGDFVSALFASYSGQVYSFDIAVRPFWQSHGLGRQLLAIALANYNEIVEADPYADIKLNVVNDIMEEALLRRGFIVIDRGFGATVMTKED